MSRKRNNIPFAISDQHDTPAAKRRRNNATTSLTSPIRGISESLDVVVFSRPLRSRRLASVKAQIANTSLLNAEHHRSRSSSPIGNECNMETDDREEPFVVKNPLPVSLPSGAPERPQRFSEKISQKRIKGEKSESCSSSLSPLSSLESEWDEEKVVDVKLKGPPPTIRTPVLHLVPCREKPVQSQPKAKKKVDNPPMKLNGYVRRMASLNARACVSAMMEPVRRPSKKNSMPPSVPEPPIPSPKSPVQSPQECLSIPCHRVSPAGSPVSQPAIMNHSWPNNTERENVTSPSSSKGYVVVCGSPNTLTECGIIQGSGYSEAEAFNAEGLLWNGDTLHPQSRVYLNPDGTLPHLIVPPVCPTKPSRVQETKVFAKTQQQKKRKKPTAVKVSFSNCHL